MKKEGYYSSGQFMKLAGITKKTIRYYDEKNILKPSLVTENGTRFYTDNDLVKLRQIMLLKYLGFSLNDIKDMQVDYADKHYINNSLNIQLKLVEDRIEQLKLVADTIKEATGEMEAESDIDWSRLFEQLHVTDLESTLKKHYKNASNIMARINLHKLYSTNMQGWFDWAFDCIDLKEGQKLLELGCGAGNIWVDNIHKIKPNIDITISDISDGMLRDARREISIAANDNLIVDAFNYVECECEHIPYPDNTFDIVIANHVLFYCKDVEAGCKEIMRVLKKGGKLYAGTYGNKHMMEVSKLVSDYDERIVLAAENLYDRFGKENGGEILGKYFEEIKWIQYEDSLYVTEAEPLISYVLSCHGNQNQFISDNYSDFRHFMKKRLKEGFYITKDAGIFVARKG